MALHRPGAYRSIRRGAFAIGGLLAVTVLAGCASSSSSAAPAAPAAPAAEAGSLHVADTALGKVVVDGAGMTVYMLTADTAGHSSCSQACLMQWPAVAAPASGAPTATGLTAAVATTATTTGGTTLTVGGWPVYTFALDSAPGDTKGEGVAAFGGTWYALSPAGTPIMSAGASSSSGGYVRGY